MDSPVTSTAELGGDGGADAPAAPVFLDVPALLERSQPRQYPKLFWYVLGVMLLAVMLSTYLGRQGRGMQIFVELMSGLVMIGLMVGMAAVTYVMAARQRAEVKQLETVEELVQLRRWPQAAVALEGLLSAPTRTPHARVQALIYLTSVLARYHRFEEAI